MKILTVLILMIALGACDRPQVPTVTPEPPTETAIPTETAVVFDTPTPTETEPPTVTPSLVPSPTSNLPMILNAPFPAAIGSVNVLDSYCLSRASVWVVEYWGMTFTFNQGWYERCKAASEFLPTLAPWVTPYRTYTPTPTRRPPTATRTP